MPDTGSHRQWLMSYCEPAWLFRLSNLEPTNQQKHDPKNKNTIARMPADGENTRRPSHVSSVRYGIPTPLRKPISLAPTVVSEAIFRQRNCRLSWNNRDDAFCCRRHDHPSTHIHGRIPCLCEDCFRKLGENGRKTK